MKEKKIIKADMFLKKMMWERLKYFSLKGTLKAYRKMKRVENG